MKKSLESSGVLEVDRVSGKWELVSVKGQPETGAEPQSQTPKPTPAQPTKQFTKHCTRQTRKYSKCKSKSQASSCQSTTSCRVLLVGKKSLLKCLISGYPVTVLFDSGSQVSIVDRQWVRRHIPCYAVRPLQELLENELEVYAVSGQAIPYDGWAELTVTLAGQEDPNLTVQAPFLVSKLSLPQPLLGANVLGAISQRQKSDKDAIATLITLLHRAFGMEEEQVVAMVNFIQVPRGTDCDPATVRTEKDNIIIPARKAVQGYPKTLTLQPPLCSMNLHKKTML